MKRNIFQKQDDSEITEPVESTQEPETKAEVQLMRLLQIRHLSAIQRIL